MDETTRRFSSTAPRQALRPTPRAPYSGSGTTLSTTFTAPSTVTEVPPDVSRLQQERQYLAQQEEASSRRRVAHHESFVDHPNAATKRPRLGVNTAFHPPYVPNTVSPTDVTDAFSHHQPQTDAGDVSIAGADFTGGGTYVQQTTAATRHGIAPAMKAPSQVISYVQDENKEEMDPDQLRHILDTMWEEQAQSKLKNVPLTVMPRALLTPLLDHQIEGIRWLLHQETSKDTALSMYTFREYATTGTKRWISKITGQHLSTEPKPIHGAILADAMGLGKTIQTLGLMLANPPPIHTRIPMCTLIVCPVSVIGNWTKQIQQHVVPGTWRVAIYAGSKAKRAKLVSTKLRTNQLDVLLVSYEMLRSDFVDHRAAKTKKMTMKQFGGACHGDEGDAAGTAQTKFVGTGKAVRKKIIMEETLFDVMFHRAVLDEAHAIRNSATGVYHAARKIQAVTKVCLTGTPFVNQPDDMHSLLAFLGVESISDSQIFREKITKPMQAGKSVGLSRLRTAIGQVTMRRSKATVNLNMVAKEKRLVKISFPEGSHKKIHDDLFVSSKVIFDTLRANDGKPMTFKHHGEMFELLLRIRQACCSGSLVPVARRVSAMRVAREARQIEGALDVDQAQSMLQRLSASAPPSADNSAIMTAATGTPPKIVALLRLIDEMKPDEKGVIFSQWVSFLDIIQRELEAHGHSVTRLTGSMTANQRMQAMEQLNREDVTTSPRFCLCQIKAAGTGISLDRANVVFLTDVWFNQAVHDQAMDRVHRISSTRDVRVYTLVMKDTIEERLLDVQKRKATLGKGTLQKLSEEEARDAKMTTMKDLFDFEEEEDDEYSV